ncbi:hypothetical protein HDU98_006681 [Podochytrium sp. JEL0797]|nr:hypothetical protein HDU98_006681 [Podochytrium sp. JEL0797]
MAGSTSSPSTNAVTPSASEKHGDPILFAAMTGIAVPAQTSGASEKRRGSSRGVFDAMGEDVKSADQRRMEGGDEERGKGGFQAIEIGLWSVENVCAWLESLNYDEDVVDKFRDKECTGHDLKAMSASDDNCFEVLTTRFMIPGFGTRLGLVQQIRGLFTTNTQPVLVQADDFPPAYIPLPE